MKNCRHQSPKFISSTNEYRCPDCGERFEEREFQINLPAYTKKIKSANAAGEPLTLTDHEYPLDQRKR